MNLILIPTIVSVIALAVLVVAVGLGSLLTMDPSSAEAGRTIRRRGGNAAVAALVFAWAGIMFAAIVGALAGDRAGVLALWGSGPLGCLVGLMWPAGARPGAPQALSKNHAEPIITLPAVQQQESMDKGICGPEDS